MQFQLGLRHFTYPCMDWAENVQLCLRYHLAVITPCVEGREKICLLGKKKRFLRLCEIYMHIYMLFRKIKKLLIEAANYLSNILSFWNAIICGDVHLFDRLACSCSCSLLFLLFQWETRADFCTLTGQEEWHKGRKHRERNYRGII